VFDARVHRPSRNHEASSKVWILVIGLLRLVSLDKILFRSNNSLVLVVLLTDNERA
jgi:hypothetical protein